MSSLLEPNKFYRPFTAPWAFDLTREHEQAHWVEDEAPVGDDVADWKGGKVTESEKDFVTQILRMFTTQDLLVGGFYYDLLIPRFQNNEVRNMLGSFAVREGTHQRAYALLNDTLGLPEGDYAAFMDYAEMREKAEFAIAADPSTHAGLGLALAKGVFNEGLSLFASFVMLLNFQRRGLFKGMSKVVEWSIRDETIHVIGVAHLFRAFCDEQPQIVTDRFKHAIYDMAREAVRLEDAFIDLAYRMGEVEGLTAAEVKQYIRFIADRRLQQLGLKPNFMVEKNPLPWLDWIVSAASHQNFFEGKETEYSVAGLQGDWSFGAMFSPPKMALLAKAPAITTRFRVYSKAGCPFCKQAKALLDARGYSHHDLDLTDDFERQKFYNGRGFKDHNRTVPKVYVMEPGVGEKLIGGYAELVTFLGEG